MSDENGKQGGGPPDMEALAKRYMDLWQTQVSAMASDPKLAEAMSKTMAFMSGAAREAQAAASGGAPNDSPERTAPKERPTAEPPKERPTAAGPAPGPSGPDVERMAERIDGLERRVAILEAALGGLLAQSYTGGGSDRG